MEPHANEFNGSGYWPDLERGQRTAIFGHPGARMTRCSLGRRAPFGKRHSRDLHHRQQPGLLAQSQQGTGVHMRKIFILFALVFALVTMATATVVTTAVTSDSAMALATR